MHVWICVGECERRPSLRLVQMQWGHNLAISSLHSISLGAFPIRDVSEHVANPMGSTTDPRTTPRTGSRSVFFGPGCGWIPGRRWIRGMRCGSVAHGAASGRWKRHRWRDDLGVIFTSYGYLGVYGIPNKTSININNRGWFVLHGFTACCTDIFHWLLEIPYGTWKRPNVQGVLLGRQSEIPIFGDPCWLKP